MSYSLLVQYSTLTKVRQKYVSEIKLTLFFLSVQGMLDVMFSFFNKGYRNFIRQLTVVSVTVGLYRVS